MLMIRLIVRSCTIGKQKLYVLIHLKIEYPHDLYYLVLCSQDLVVVIFIVC